MKEIIDQVWNASASAVLNTTKEVGNTLVFFFILFGAFWIVTALVLNWWFSRSMSGDRWMR